MTSEGLGRNLYDSGWRQGSELVGSATQVVTRSFGSADREEFSSDGDGLILTTQDCDLVKSAAIVPVLEMIGFRRDPEKARSTKANNSRYFVVDQGTGSVADRSRKYMATREALAELPVPTSLPFGANARRARSFAKWLASAYDRPALPDEIHPELAVPLHRALDAATRPGADDEWLNGILIEVRVAGRFSEPGPWRIALLFILGEGADQDSVDRKSVV